MTPQVFGAYLLTSRLAPRSMTEVFLAVRVGDTSARVVVLKRAPLEEAASGSVAESLRREIEVLDRGRIERVATLLDHGEVAGLPFVVLEHVSGRALDALIAARPLPREAVVQLARDLALALAALHERGWVHGDVTPSNVMIDDAGELTLVDLGIARRIDEPREMPAGTPGYASPEAALGKPARAADDVYGWGVVIAECLLGAPLFREADLAEAALRSARLPSAVMDLQPVVDALALAPERRPSAQSIAARLEPSGQARRTLADAVHGAQLRDIGPPSAPDVLRTAAPWPPSPTPAPPLAVAATTAGAPLSPPVQPHPLRRAQAAPAKSGGTVAVVAIVLSVAAVLGSAGGFLLGRRSSNAAAPAKRRESTTLTLPTIPPRAEVKLDGRTLLTPSSSTNLEIEPGTHKLTVQIARREPREYEFVAEPGDHVVLVVVPVLRGLGKDTDP